MTFNKEDGVSYTEFFAFNKTVCRDINNIRDSDCCSRVLQKYNKYSNPPDGWFMRYWKNGNLRYEWYFKDGKQDGVSKSWWPSGQIKSIQNYMNGKLEKKMAWYENGSPHVINDDQISGIRTYKNGNRDGIWIDYYKSGQMWCKKTYNNNKLVSEKYWGEDGSVATKHCHKKGEFKQFRKINPNWI